MLRVGDAGQCLGGGRRCPAWRSRVKGGVDFIRQKRSQRQPVAAGKGLLDDLIGGARAGEKCPVSKLGSASSMSIRQRAWGSAGPRPAGKARKLARRRDRVDAVLGLRLMAGAPAQTV